MNGGETLIGANDLKLRFFKMFTNLKTVVLFTRYDGSNKLHYPFSMESFLSFISEMDSSVRYNIIAFSDNKETATWLHQAMNKELEQKFEEKGWEIYKELDGDFQFFEIYNPKFH